MPSGIRNKNAQNLRLVRKKRAEKRKLANPFSTRENSQSGGHAQLEIPLSESLLRRVNVEDDDSDCDHPLATGDSASGNEDSGSDSDSDRSLATQ